LRELDQAGRPAAEPRAGGEAASSPSAAWGTPKSRTMRASGSALRAEATPTSSSRSRCAAITRRAFFPMEPVAPSRTTRFLEEGFATVLAQR